MTSPNNTPPETLVRAAEIGKEAGLQYVYAGNLPGRVDEYEDTRCPGCNKVLVRRRGYVVREYRINAQGACPSCGTKIPGIWPENPNSVRINAERIPLRVY